MKIEKRESKKDNSHFNLLIKSKKIAKSKCSQEEMVGFVLIIVLVAIIALIFLAISLRKPAGMIESKEVKNFLHSALMFTSNCQRTPETFLDFKDLVGACYNHEKCLNETEACEILNNTARGLVEKGFNIERYKGYTLKIYSGGNKTLFYLSKGNETKVRYGSEVYFYSYEIDGKVYIQLRLFY